MIAAAAFVCAGCVPFDESDPPLTVATAWPEAARRETARAFARWSDAQPGAAPGTTRIQWIELDPNDDLARVARRGSGGLFGWLQTAPDVLLGGPASCYRRLAEDRLLAAADLPGRPAWCVSRRTSVGWLVRPGRGGEPPLEVAGLGLAFDDPRRDAVALAWARAELAAEGWAEGYARLVRLAGAAPPVGRLAGSARAAVERGEAAAAPVVAPSGGHGPGFQAGSRPIPWVEGADIVAGCRRSSLAQAFVRFLDERSAAEEEGDPPAADADADALLADLLGSTLVDAQDELRVARAALERAGHPARAESWSCQAPPWPPASVAQLEADDPSGALLGTLLEQLAPDPAVRAWLFRSWLEPARPIDGARLAELARAAGGRLVREPRIRAWLRAEWTAWARQRYRHAARVSRTRRPEA